MTLQTLVILGVFAPLLGAAILGTAGDEAVHGILDMMHAGAARYDLDRFGPLPDEARQLLKIVGIKANCRRANIEKIDIGPRGAVLTLRDNTFPNPAGLIGLIQKNHAFWKIRPDQKIVVSGEWPSAEDRLKVAERITADLARVAAA